TTALHLLLLLYSPRDPRPLHSFPTRRSSDLCSSLPLSRHTLTSPHLLPAAQYCSLRLVATVQMASRASVKTVSRKVAPESVASCISTPCRDAPRMTSCDRSTPRRCPQCSRSSASTLAGP